MNVLRSGLLTANSKEKTKDHQSAKENRVGKSLPRHIEKSRLQCRLDVLHHL